MGNVSLVMNGLFYGDGWVRGICVVVYVMDWLCGLVYLVWVDILVWGKGAELLVWWKGAELEV